MCEYNKDGGFCEVHGGCIENGVKCIHDVSTFKTKDICVECNNSNCNYEAGKKVEVDEDYPNAHNATKLMIKALEAVLSSYVLCTSSAQETAEMKRARTLIGMALDEARGN